MHSSCFKSLVILSTRKLTTTQPILYNLKLCERNLLLSTFHKTLVIQPHIGGQAKKLGVKRYTFIQINKLVYSKTQDDFCAHVSLLLSLMERSANLPVIVR